MNNVTQCKSPRSGKPLRVSRRSPETDPATARAAVNTHEGLDATNGGKWSATSLRLRLTCGSGTTAARELFFGKYGRRRSYFYSPSARCLLDDERRASSPSITPVAREGWPSATRDLAHVFFPAARSEEEKESAR